MALISCPECSQQVSTKAATCPHCGYPLLPAQKRQVAFELRSIRIKTDWMGFIWFDNNLAEYLAQGWQVVSVCEDFEWRERKTRYFDVYLQRECAPPVREKPKVLVQPKEYVYFEKYGYGVVARQDGEAYYVNFNGVEGVKKLLKQHPAVKVVTKEEYENSIEKI